MKMQRRLALLFLSAFPASALHAQAPARQPTSSIHLDIGRDKVKMIGIRLSDVFQAPQTSLGGFWSVIARLVVLHPFPLTGLRRPCDWLVNASS